MNLNAHANAGGSEAVAEIRRLVAEGANVNGAKEFHVGGQKPLHMASLRGHSDVVEVLISLGANVNVANEYYESPLALAAGNGRTQIVRMLIHAGADVNAGRPLSDAAVNGDVQAVEALLEAGAVVDGCNSSRMRKTALHRAAHSGRLDTVRLLVCAGADIARRDANGDSALLFACQKNHRDVANYLLSAGAEACARNEDGDSPAGFAAFHGLVDTLDRMISVKVELCTVGDVFARTPLRATARTRWSRDCHPDAAQLLLDAGVSTALNCVR